jgi:uncharacterized membrane protein YphA (DoxX/SURF4 family)
MKPNSNPVVDGLLFVSRVVLCGVFGLAASTKLSSPQEFAFAVDAFEVLPKNMVPVATFVVPWIEAICAGLLLVGLWTRASAAVAGLLLAGFIALTISAIMRNLSLSCGCFGKVRLLCPEKLGWCNVIQNTILMLPAIFLAVKGHGRLGIDGVCRCGAGSCGPSAAVDGGGTPT